jgi:NCAIR mutase (PurE)-related protein
MNQKYLKEILSQIEKGSLNADAAFNKIKALPFDLEKLEYATVDLHRNIRLGLGEVVYGEHKSVKQIIAICKKLGKSKEPVLITRLADDKTTELKKHFRNCRVNSVSNTVTINPIKLKENCFTEPYVCIITAGTTDIPFAEEAVDVCGATDTAFVKLYDIGVAGIHRVLDKIEIMDNSSVLIVVAGMEGALPSVIGGIINKPIIAVPTDIGYGANFNGLSALLSMLTSCAPGISVTNINGGFTAGFAAFRIIYTIKEKMSKTR